MLRHGLLFLALLAPLRAQEPQPRAVALQVVTEDGQPLPDVRVVARLRLATGKRLEDPLVAATNAEGRVRLQVPAGQRFGVALTLECKGRLALRGSCQLAPTGDLELDRVTMPRLVPVAVQVRDKAGRPVAGVQVRLHLRSAGFMRPARAPRGTTDDSGNAGQLQAVLGTASATIRGLPLEFGSEERTVRVTVLAGRPLVLTVERPDPARCVSGVVHDAWENPVGGVDLSLVNGGGWATTSANGRFLFVLSAESGNGPFEVRLYDSAEVELRAPQQVRAGQRDVVLRLRKPASLELRVRDAATGEPVEDFAVICFRVQRQKNGMIGGSRDRRFEGVHPGGELVIQPLLRGHNKLLVQPLTDSGYLPSGYLSVQVAENTGPVTVELHRPQPFRVRVRDSAGNPIAGCTVQLVERPRADADPTTMFSLHENSFRSSRFGAYLLLCEATSGADGTAELLWQPWEHPARLRAFCPEILSTEVPAPPLIPGMDPIAVRVGRGATLLGKASGFDVLKKLAVKYDGTPVPRSVRPRVVLRNAATGEIDEGVDGKAYPIEADGSFECRGIRPGRWQVLFRYNRPMSSGAIVQTLPHVLAEAVLDSGKEVEVAVDLSVFEPATLHGRVLLDGKPVRPQAIGYSAYGRDHMDRPKSFLGISFTDRFENEQYTLPALLPADYLFSITVESDDGVRRRFTQMDQITVKPGEDREFDLHFEHRIARVRLVDPEGKPVSRRLIGIGKRGGPFLVSDDEGWIVVDPAPARTFVLRAFAAGFTRERLWAMRSYDPRARTTELGEIRLDQTQKTTEVKLVVRK